MAAKRNARPKGTATRAAASIGSALGMVAGRVDKWLAQRQDIEQELDAVIGRAQELLTSLGREAGEMKRQASATMKTATRAAKQSRRKAAK
jgi:hypothetical protein